MLLLKIGVVVKVLRSLAAVICNFLYRIIATMYQLFMTISRLDILSSDQIAPIYQRITMILTIVMTFYITFEFVKYTIQPDMMTDKDKGMGNILQRIVLVVIMIAFVPTIFRFAYSLQSRIVESQLISKVLLGRTNTNYVSYGNEFSAVMLNLFYDVDPDNCSNMRKGDCTKASTTVTNNLNNLKTKGTVDIASDINLAADEEFNLVPLLAEIDPAIKFDGIFAIIVGVFIAYVLAMYCIDLGARYVQLIFLQIISPIAIMGYLLPKKDGIFQKWLKQCTTTYLDLFLRIAIIDFVLLIIKILGDAFDNGNIFSGITGVTPTLKALTYVALVLGLLMFAQRAPKLLSDLFPSSGAAGIGFGLGAKGRLEPAKKAFTSAKKGITNTANTGARVAGGVGGAIAGATVGQGVRGRLRAALAGAKEGARKDNKGMPHRRIERGLEAAQQRVYQEDEIARNVPKDISREEAIRQATYHKEHWANVASEQDRRSKLFETPSTGMDAINKNIDEFKQIKALKQELESAKSRGASAAEVKTLDAKYKSAVTAVRKAIASISDEKGNVDQTKFEQLLRTGIKFKYNELDANGFAIEYEPVYEIDPSTGKIAIDAATGQPKVKIDPSTGRTMMKKKDKIEVDYRFDDGDMNYAGSVARAEVNEYAKMQAAADELSKDSVTKGLFNDVEVEINGVKKKITEWLADPKGREIYAENVNKFKDAMINPKNAYENSKEFIEAHAYKDGIPGGSSGGKK